MESIKFIDLLHFSDDDFKKLKLVFNSNWNYTPSGRPDYVREIFGEEDRYFDLLEMYRQDEVELVRESTKLHNPDNKRFLNGELAFCFIPYDDEDWLLVNAFKVVDDSKKLIKIDEETLSAYRRFFGRLVITWKNRNTRNIRMKSIEQIEKLTVKTILEKPLNELSTKFPGYKNVAVSYPELKKKLRTSSERRSFLKARKGIYLISDVSNGKLYIGSAYGKDGIYGRWNTYMESGFDKNEVENGKYPNKEFQKIVKERGIDYIRRYFRYSLLETFTDEISDEDIINRESWWKDRLLTREYGYNAN